MPILPTYAAKGNIQALPVGAQIQNSDADVQSVGLVAKTMTGIAQKWSDTQDVMQYTKAKYDYSIKTTAIAEKADRDQSWKNTDAYWKELDKAKNESMKGISNAMVADKLNLELNHDNEIMKIKIDSTNKKKEIEFTRTIAVPNTILQKNNEMVNAGLNPTLFVKARNDRNDIIDLNVKAGVYSEVEGYEMKLKAEKDAATNAIYSNLEVGIAQLDNGFYDLTPEETSKLKSEAIKLQARQKKDEIELKKEARFSYEGQIVADLAKGKYPSPQALTEGRASGLITDNFFNNLTDLMNNPVAVGAVTKNSKLVQSNIEIFKAGTKEQMETAITNTLRGGGDGQLAEDDLRLLLASAIQRAQDMRTEDGNAVDTMLEWSKSYYPEEQTEVFRSFMQKRTQGTPVEQALVETLQESNKRVKSDMSLYPITGQVLLDPYTGKMRRYYPTGKWEDVN